MDTMKKTGIIALVSGALAVPVACIDDIRGDDRGQHRVVASEAPSDGYLQLDGDPLLVLASQLVPLRYTLGPSRVRSAWKTAAWSSACFMSARCTGSDQMDGHCGLGAAAAKRPASSAACS